MLIKSFFQTQNYTVTLRRRQFLFVGLCLLGIVLVVLGHRVLPLSGLPSFIQGFYCGAGAGLACTGAFFSLRTAYLLRHPAAAKKAQVTERDEREKAILNASTVCVFWVNYLVTAAALFLSLPFSRTVFFTLLAVFALNCLTLLAAQLWYRGRM